MASEENVNRATWDPFSEQPYPIRQRFTLIDRMRQCFRSHAKSLFVCLAALPLIFVWQGGLSLGFRPLNWRSRSNSPREFMGLAVALQSCDAPRLAEEIKTLGARQILLRFPVWEMDRLEEHWEFVQSLPDCEIVMCIMQDRPNVVSHELWRKNLNTIVQRFWPRIKDYQIGQGINRSKWGVFGCDEFLAFASIAEELRSQYSGIRLVGPCVLDFETIPFIRSMLHGYPISWDVVGSGLYVDRRGCPRNRQLLIFNLTQKIYHFAACVLCANKAKRRFWITEVNWPLENQGAYSPTGDKECVSESDAATNLKHYYEDAWRSGVVERVYWWQLVSKGYGLIDVESDGSLRYRPAYHEFKKLLQEGIQDANAPHSSHPPEEFAESSASAPLHRRS